MNNKEALKEDITNIMYGDATDAREGTSIEPNDRVVNELSDLVMKEAIAFAFWILSNNYHYNGTTWHHGVSYETRYSTLRLYSLYQQTINTEK
jgi:hypothetical protein